MAVQIQSIGDIEHYQGEHAIPGIRFRPARQAMGVSAWGMNVIEFDPWCDGYPEHGHGQDGQEEVYVVLDGAITLVADGEEHELRRGDMARVGPETRRKLVTRDEPAAVLAVGATPGRAYGPDRRLATE